MGPEEFGGWVRAVMERRSAERHGNEMQSIAEELEEQPPVDMQFDELEEQPVAMPA